MEGRASERARVRALGEERRRLIEQTRKEEEMKTLEQEAKLIKQKKLEILEAKRLKKIQEQELKKQKERQLIYLRDMNSKAIIHYNKYCLRYSGFIPWINYINYLRNLNELALNNVRRNCMRFAFCLWSTYCNNKRTQMNAFAQNVREIILKRSCLNSWKKIGYFGQLAEQRAKQFHHRQLERQTISHWFNYICDLYLIERKNGEIAKNHYHKHLLAICLKMWSHFPTLQRKEREREYRRDQMREWVKDIVPDFNPPKIEEYEFRI